MDPPSFPALSVMISEVAWAGTQASAYDEWIELHNPGDEPIDLVGWQLSDGDDVQATLNGSIPAFGFYLLERTDDSTVASITADVIYTGSLKNSGELLKLFDPSGDIIDSANIDGGSWPAGDAGTRRSMERWGGGDRPGNWKSFPGTGGNGLDADGHAISGTPHQPNAIWFPTDSTPSPTPSPPATASPPSGTPFAPLSALINEIAWAGTVSSSSDEWLELYNNSDSAIDLSGWILSDGQDIEIHLSGSIEARSYFLLERTDDNVIVDIAADQVFSGSLRNTGEHLVLQGPSGTVIDTADGSGGWPAGDSDTHSSMERLGGSDIPGNWRTFTGYFGVGHDSGGGAIQGTPRSTNSVHFPTPQPTWIPGKIVVNEVLIRPHFDWQGTGGVDTDDEFIELYNIGPSPVNLRGWTLDDLRSAGSSPFKLPGRTIPSGGFVVFFRSRTHIALNDAGDTVRLLDPSGNLVDSISYLRIRASNLSYGRFPDGSGHLAYGLWPTARGPNLLFVEVAQSAHTEKRIMCPLGKQGLLRIPRMNRPAYRRIPVGAHAQISCPSSAATSLSGIFPNPVRDMPP